MDISQILNLRNMVFLGELRTFVTFYLKNFDNNLFQIFLLLLKAFSVQLLYIK